MSYQLKSQHTQGWRDGSAFKSTGCTCRGPGDQFVAPTCWLTPVPGDQGPPSDLMGIA